MNIPSHGYNCTDSLKQDPVLGIIDKNSDHPGIKLIKAKINLKFLNLAKLTPKTCQILDLKRGSQKDNVKIKVQKVLFCKVHM